MAKVNPLTTGLAFAATVSIGYAACTILFAYWPDAAVNFMNGLFHGLDFRKLQSGPALFDFGSFLWALVVMALWAFGLGTIFSWMLDHFAHD